jgi:S1-C subfamily serine protease
VLNVDPGGPADGKLQRGDQIIAFNGERLQAIQDYDVTPHTKTIRLTILRDEREIEVTIEPTEIRLPVEMVTIRSEILNAGSNEDHVFVTPL